MSDLLVADVFTTLMTAEEAFEKFLRLSVADGDASGRTLRLYRAGLTSYLHWCRDAGVDPRTARFDDVEAYRAWLIAAKFKRASINLRLVAVRALYTAFQRWGNRPDNPAAGVKTPRDKEAAVHTVLRKTLSPEQARHFLAVLPGSWAPHDVRDATVCRLMMFHGLRAGEIAALELGSVDLQSFSSLQVIGKGSKLRTLLLNAETRKDLIAWTSLIKHPAPNTPLFFGFDTPGMNRLSVRGIERIVDKWLTVAGLKQKGRSAHALRHTAAVLAILGGAKEQAVAQSFGHASTDTTSVYTRAAAAFQENPADAVSRALETK